MCKTDRLINIVDRAKERISEIVEISIQTSKTEMQRGQKEWKKGNIISKNCGTITNSVNTHNGNNREERQKGKKEYLLNCLEYND